MFTKREESWINKAAITVGMVIQPTDELFDVEITGGTVEFKITIGEDYSSHFPQAIANMIRVASNLIVNALTTGKIVQTVKIYGMLVSYNKAKCVPLKYYIDFEKNATEILIGESESFSDIFITLYAL